MPNNQIDKEIISIYWKIENLMFLWMTQKDIILVKQIRKALRFSKINWNIYSRNKIKVSITTVAQLITDVFQSTPANKVQMMKNFPGLKVSTNLKFGNLWV